MMRILAYGFMLALLGVLGWWLLRPDPSAVSIVESGIDEKPDQFLENIHMRHMDETGRLLFELHARHMAHFPSDGRATLDDITLDYYSPEYPPWLLEAQAGLIPAGRRHLHLAGEVRVTMRLDENTPLTLLRTPALDIDLEAHQAASDSGVVITRAGTELRGDAMHADLDNGVIRLDTNVRGQHVPPAR